MKMTAWDTERIAGTGTISVYLCQGRFCIIRKMSG